MLSRGLGVVLAVSALIPAAAIADSGGTVTATGTGRAPVTPTNRMDDAAIRAAVSAARRRAIPAAIADARSKGSDYAGAAGLLLGAIQSVSDAGVGNAPPFDFPAGPAPFLIAVGPGGIANYCGIARQPIYRQVGRRRQVVRFVTHKACYVPPSATVTLTVTYAATPALAGLPGGKSGGPGG
jgi:hypothetical protein